MGLRGDEVLLSGPWFAVEVPRSCCRGVHLLEYCTADNGAPRPGSLRAIPLEVAERLRDPPDHAVYECSCQLKLKSGNEEGST